MSLQWTSALSVGVPDIDEQHRELFRRVDCLLDAMIASDRAEGLRLVDFLREYVILHFDAEEELMRRAGYPGLADHALEHRAFAGSVEALAREFDARGATAALVLRLEQDLCGWLRDHVCGSDAALGRWVRSARREAR